jgi:hypothetical protein
MSIQISLEQPAGTPSTTREFAPGSTLHVAIKVKDSLGLPGIAQSCRLDVDYSVSTAIAFSQTGVTNIAGDFAWDVPLPLVNTKGTVTAWVFWQPLGGTEKQVTTIGVGVQPSPVPKPINWTTIALIAGGFIGVGLLGFGIYRLSQSRKPQEVVFLPPSQQQRLLTTR